MGACTSGDSQPQLRTPQAEALVRSPDSNTVLWSIGGSVSQANPNAWVAVRNSNDVLYIFGTNNFTFPTYYVNNTAYDVSIAGNDSSLSCSITNNTGVIHNARIANVAVSCSPRPAAVFVNGFESYDVPPDWSNTVDDSWGTGGANAIGGYCCGMIGPQSMVTDMESAHSGTGALVYSGVTLGHPGDERAFLKIFDLSALALAGGSYLSYWIYPQSNASDFGGGVAGRQSAYSAVDVTLSNGTALRILPGIKDQFGNSVAPASQGNLVLDTWNFVLVDMSSVFGESLTNLSIGWQNNNSEGGYRGYLDDIIIDYTPPLTAPGMSTSWEAYESQPSWVDTVDTDPPARQSHDVIGLCCGATGPRAYVSSEAGYTGHRSLIYAGQGTGTPVTRAYMKILDLSHSNVVLNGLSVLSYRVYPQSPATFGAVSGALSASVALDVIFSDGTTLQDNGLVDSNGHGVTPSEQSQGLTLDAWNLVSIPLGSLAGKTPVRIDVGWDVPGAAGGYRGRIDDINIGNPLIASVIRSPALVRIVLASAPSLLVGAHLQLNATGIYSDGSKGALNSNATYTSDNPGVASVDANGYVTTVSIGVAQIRVAYEGVTSPPYYVVVNPVTYNLGGSVTGLQSGTAVNLIQGRDHIFAPNGSFTFPTGVAANTAYTASLINPAGESCVFVGNSNAGTMPGANTSSIAVTCTTNSYTLGGQIVGLVSNTQVNVSVGSQTQSSANGSYVFATPLPYRTSYSIGIGSPAGQSCIFSPAGAGAGVMPAAAVTNANILCTPFTYPLGGSVSGLVTGNVILVNTVDGETLQVANGSYTFNQNVVYGGNYNVVATAPSGSTCMLIHGNANMVVGGQFNVNVSCQLNPHLLGGSVSGLLANTNVTLADSSDTIMVTNGNFTFPTPVAYNTNFVVSLTNPAGQTCVFVSNSNAGVMPGTNDYNIVVNCSTNAYSLGGSISGLLTNTNVSLANGADSLSVTNGNFVFPTAVVFNSNFAASLSQPSGQNCSFVSNSNSGVMPAANDTNILISCTANPPTYFIVSGYTTPREAGLNSNVTITAYDLHNTIAAGYTGTIHITTGDVNAVFSPNVTFTSTMNGNAAVPITMLTVGTWWINANDIVTPGIAGRQSSIIVNPNVATHLRLVAPATTVAGQPIQLTVTAFDQYNNIATAYNKTVSVASSDVTATLPSNYTFYPPTDQGNTVLPTTLTLYKAGVQAATVSDNASNLPGSANITVLPASPNQITLVLASTSTAGAALSPNVTIEDLYGNVTPSFTGTVTFSITDTQPHAAKPAPTSMSGNSGQKVFTNGVIFATAGNQTLTVTDTPDGLLAASQVVVVSPNVVANVNMTVSPTFVAGQTQVMAVAVNDAYGNIVTNYTGSVSLDSNDYQSLLVPNAYTFSAADMGSTNVIVTLATAGVRYIHGVSSATGNPNTYLTVTISPNTVSRLLFSAPQVVTINTPVAASVSGVDPYGNVISSYTGSISISSSDPNGSPASGSPASVSVSSGGTVALSGIDFGTLDAQTLTATDAGHGISGVHQLVVHQNMIFTTGQNANVSLTNNVGNNAGNSYYGANGKFYHADSYGQVFAIWNALPVTNVAPNTVISGGAATSATSLNQPMSMVSDGNTGIFLVDNASHRVLHYNTTPASALNANSAIGQQNLTASVQACSPNGLSRPTDVAVVPNANVVLVADCGNSRVMVYSPIPYKNGANAQLALGQVSMTACSTSGASATRVGAYCSGSLSLWTDGQRVVVGDPGFNRLLIFNSLATILQQGTSAPSANVVIGQASMTGSANPGANPNAYTLYGPQFITSDGTQLIVTDTTSHRTLIYNPFPTGNRPAASVVLGQTGFSTGTSGATLSTMSYPQGLTLGKNYMYVHDHQNGRVLVFASQ